MFRRGLAQDLRLATRQLRRQPMLLIVTTLLLGLGIGAVSVFFSIVDALLLRPLPVRDPQELVRVVQIRPNLAAGSYFHESFLRALREGSRTLRDAFAWQEYNVPFVESGAPERIRAEGVSGNYFVALGVGAALG